MPRDIAAAVVDSAFFSMSFKNFISSFESDTDRFCFSMLFVSISLFLFRYAKISRKSRTNKFCDKYF